jgi:hypothetical protein
VGRTPVAGWGTAIAPAQRRGAGLEFHFWVLPAVAQAELARRGIVAASEDDIAEQCRPKRCGTGLAPSLIM